MQYAPTPTSIFSPYKTPQFYHFTVGAQRLRPEFAWEQVEY
ncbi:MAG: hypothetical protein AB4290_12795 [Spirulina sp.]